jgi:hypothetical protein
LQLRRPETLIRTFGDGDSVVEELPESDTSFAVRLEPVRRRAPHAVSEGLLSGGLTLAAASLVALFEGGALLFVTGSNHLNTCETFLPTSTGCESIFILETAALALPIGLAVGITGGVLSDPPPRRVQTDARASLIPSPSIALSHQGGMVSVAWRF